MTCKIDRKNGKPSSGPSNGGEVSQHKEGKTKATREDTIHLGCNDRSLGYGRCDTQRSDSHRQQAGCRSYFGRKRPAIWLANDVLQLADFAHAVPFKPEKLH